MFGKKNKNQEAPIVEEKKEKPIPAYLREDYPYKAVGEPITDLDSLESNKLYEIKCGVCDLAVRSQGVNIKSTYQRMIYGVEIKNDDGTTRIEGGKGCIGCGNRKLVVRMVDTSKMAKG